MVRKEAAVPASEALGLWGVAVAVCGRRDSWSIPYLFVSLGECLTKRAEDQFDGSILLMGP